MTNQELKCAILQFNPVIYPSLLWVVIGDKTDKDRFPSVGLMEDNSLAQTESTNDALNNKNGVLIRFRSRSVITAETITHEAVHAAAEFMRYIGGEIDVRNQEPFAYLCGWVADCIDQVRKNKFKS